MIKYDLRRVGDGAGCTGRQSWAIEWKEDGTFGKTQGVRPVVGLSMHVLQGLSYFWLTTEVTEILEDTPNMVRFKTTNSEYVWRIIDTSVPGDN